MLPIAQVHAQEMRRVSYNIPPQALTTALTAFARASDLRLAYPAALTQGIMTQGVRGDFAPEQALASLLEGAGLSYAINGGTVSIAKPSGSEPIAYDGSIILEEIDVTAWVENAGVGWDGSPESVYMTPGSVSVITGEMLERFAGTTPSDMLKSAPGVLSGESRNSGGLDVNIRGMQGMSRVAVSVDGAQNSTSVYRGYQGIANRSFVDPDFISGVSISKGPSGAPGAAGAIGGSVNMRTITADDIVPEGESFGMRLKVEGSNNTTPVKAAGGANLAEEFDGLAMVRSQVQRPGLFDVNGGSSSIVVAAKSEAFDLVAGFSRRRYGNYHAGETGPNAPQKSEPHYLCALYPGYCDGMEFYKPGLTAYLPGEEVLNTSQDTTSGLLKGTFRYNDEHVLELGYSRYESRYGETYPMGFITNLATRNQGQPSHTAVDSGTARYSYKPENPLIDFQWNAWGTSLVESSALSDASLNFAEKWAKSFGTDIANTSRFSVFGGDLALQYGLSYKTEATAPSPDAPTSGILPRNGERKEGSVFLNAELNPTDWLELTAGTRYHTYEAKNNTPGNTTPLQSDNALDFSAGVAVTPIEGVQLFGNYGRAARLPSLFEAVGGFQTLIAPGLTPEIASNFEAGINLQKQDLLFAGDTAGLKLAYFNNTTKDYISRAWEQRLAPHPIWGGPPYLQNFMVIDNIDQAKFSGFEMSAHYDTGSFSADLNGTYYNNVEFCRTASTCINSSLAADYATNQIPPEYTASLTLSQKFLEDRLTLGGRMTYIGPRAARAQPTQSGASPFIAAIPWEPYAVFDLFGRYELSDYATLTFGIENVTDLYYVDPLNLALMPSPGRTVKVGIVGEFSPASGGGEPWLDGLEPLSRNADGQIDWTGFYAGIHGSQWKGNAEALDFKRFVGAMKVEDRDFFLGDIGGMGVGLQGGYLYQLSNNFVLGVEGEVTWSGAKFNAMTTSDTSFKGSVDWLASANALVGFTADRFMVYGKAGVTVGSTHLGRVIAGHEMVSQDNATGWTVGAGLEYAVTDNFSVKGEYSFTLLEGGPYGGSMPSQTTTTDGLFKFDQVKVGMNYRF